MLVSNRMTKDPVTVSPDDLLIQGRLKMQKGGFRRLPVVSDGQVIGIITDRDMREHAGYLDRTAVKAAMSRKPLSVTPATTLEAAAQLLLRHKIGGLPVVENGHLVGIVTISDVLQAFLDVMGASEETSTRIDFALQGEGTGLAEASKIVSQEGGETFSVLALIGASGVRLQCATCACVPATQTRSPKCLEIKALRYWGCTPAVDELFELAWSLERLAKEVAPARKTLSCPVKPAGGSEFYMDKTRIEKNQIDQIVHIPANGIKLEGALVIPAEAQGIVLFAHGSGSSRHSPRNNFVAQVLQSEGMGTLLMDLLTPQEDATYETRFDIDLLTQRLEHATQWLREQPQTRLLQIGYFGASTGAAAALQAAATLGASIGAVVSRGGRPDLAMSTLDRVQSPTLLIVGGLDDIVIDLNRKAYGKLKAEKGLEIVPGATHLFEEPGTLKEAARLAADWFKRHLGSKAQQKSHRKLGP